MLDFDANKRFDEIVKKYVTYPSTDLAAEAAAEVMATVGREAGREAARRAKAAAAEKVAKVMATEGEAAAEKAKVAAAREVVKEARAAIVAVGDAAYFLVYDELTPSLSLYLGSTLANINKAEDVTKPKESLSVLENGLVKSRFIFSDDQAIETHTSGLNFISNEFCEQVFLLELLDVYNKKNEPTGEKNLRLTMSPRLYAPDPKKLSKDDRLQLMEDQEKGADVTKLEKKIKEGEKSGKLTPQQIEEMKSELEVLRKKVTEAIGIGEAMQEQSVAETKEFWDEAALNAIGSMLKKVEKRKVEEKPISIPEPAIRISTSSQSLFTTPQGKEKNQEPEEDKACCACPCSII